MKYISKHSIWAILAALFFVAAVCIPVYLYLQIQSSERYVGEVAGAIAQQGVQEQTLALTRQSLEQTKEDRAALDALALPVDGVADFIDAVERQAKTAGVSLEVGEVSTTPKQGVFDTLKISFKATGTFQATSRFLHLLETVPYASTVDSIIFGTGGEKASTWTLTGSMNVPMHKTP